MTWKTIPAFPPSLFLSLSHTCIGFKNTILIQDYTKLARNVLLITTKECTRIGIIQSYSILHAPNNKTLNNNGTSHLQVSISVKNHKHSEKGKSPYNLSTWRIIMKQRTIYQLRHLCLLWLLIVYCLQPLSPVSKLRPLSTCQPIKTNRAIEAAYCYIQLRKTQLYWKNTLDWRRWEYFYDEQTLQLFLQ